MSDENEGDDYTMDQFIHYSPFPGGNASEYIIPKGKIDITSHGMGSGIYGLSQQYINKNPPFTTEHSEPYEFKIQLPYVINDEDECQRYVSASKTIMRYLQKFRDKENKNQELYTEEKINSIFSDIAQQFIDIIHDPSDLEHKWDFEHKNVSKALSEFWYDYNNRTDMVEMPINYILKKEGNDGVISKVGVSCHSWHKGDVKFIPYPTYKDGDAMPVAIILLRSGISKPEVDLRRKNYWLTKNIWIKKPLNPIKKIKCRKCDSNDHPSYLCPNRIKI